jgi:hypothetical protein
MHFKIRFSNGLVVTLQQLIQHRGIHAAAVSLVRLV